MALHRADVPALGIETADVEHAKVILTAAGGGYLGLGAQPPLPEWGAMIAASLEYERAV
jgi:peptide/nickel transport system permease protein